MFSSRQSTKFDQLQPLHDAKLGTIHFCIILGTTYHTSFCSWDCKLL